MRKFLIKFFDPVYVWLSAYLGVVGFILYGGGKGSSPAAPDYGPMAAASERAAELGTELGREQLAETKRQYEDSMKVAKPILDLELDLMKQSKDQGDDYYNYMVKNQRPVEEALNAQSMKDGSESQQNEYAARAQADTLKGYTQALNIAMRQGQRYGASTDSISAQAGNQAGAMATSLAQSANAGRQQSQDLGWARKMDVAGLYRGLTGASQGAYGVALNSGNAAMGTQAAPGQALLNGMAQGAGMQQTGMGQKVQGLGSILSSQTSVYNAGLQAAAGESAGIGSVVGSGLGMAATMI